MKKVIVAIFLFCFVPLMASLNSRIKLYGNVGDDFRPIEGLSLGQEKVDAYIDNNISVYFNLSIDQVNIQIENSETSEIVYYNEVDPRIQKQVVISDLPSGNYIIYFINPDNGCYMYGTFHKE